MFGLVTALTPAIKQGQKKGSSMTCIFCGTAIENDYCFECDQTAQDMGLDYQDLMEAF